MHGVIAAAELAGAYNVVTIIAGVLTIVGATYVIRDRRATIYKDERDAERSENDDLKELIATLKAEVNELSRTRSLEPVLDLLSATADAQRQTLDKLASFNGSLKAVKEGLEEATNGLKAVTGFIAGIHDLPLTGARTGERITKEKP